MFPDTPKTLFSRIKEGQGSKHWETSWEEFFDLYHQAVRYSVRSAFGRRGWRTVDDCIVQEIVMEVFVGIVRGHTGYDSTKGRFRLWLSGICSNRTADYIRRQARQHARTDAHGEVISEDDEALRHLREQEEDAFRVALLGTLLSTLRAEVPPRIYLIFEMIKLSGHAPEEVAQQLGIKRSVVDNSVYKAMQKLREIASTQEIQTEIAP